METYGSISLCIYIDIDFVHGLTKMCKGIICLCESPLFCICHCIFHFKKEKHLYKLYSTTCHKIFSLCIVKMREIKLTTIIKSGNHNTTI
ncbi:hypothetical protein NC651_027100 [Populus alba x Populus x berolinensis]|nr:hypothetical protein NC651_027100 [Populus alba x Populus x berolinensis]